jgi:transposase
MRYELTEFEWAAIRSFRTNKPHGIPRVDDRRVRNGILLGFTLRCTLGAICQNPMVRALHAVVASLGGGTPEFGIGSWMRWQPVMIRRCR